MSERHATNVSTDVKFSVNLMKRVEDDSAGTLDFKYRYNKTNVHVIWNNIYVLFFSLIIGLVFFVNRLTCCRYLPFCMLS